MPLGQKRRGSRTVPPASLDSRRPGLDRVGQTGDSFSWMERGLLSKRFWGFVFLLLLLAGEAGRVGCKPCPWNLPSQLRPKMSKTPDGERRGRGGEELGDGGASRQRLRKAELQRERKQRRTKKSSWPAQFVDEERGGRQSTQGAKSSGLDNYY